MPPHGVHPIRRIANPLKGPAIPSTPLGTPHPVRQQRAARAAVTTQPAPRSGGGLPRIPTQNGLVANPAVTPVGLHVRPPRPSLPNGRPVRQRDVRQARSISQSGNALAIQQHLIKQGYPIQADGIWGPQSRAAYTDYTNHLAAFQRTQWEAKAHRLLSNPNSSDQQLLQHFGFQGASQVKLSREQRQQYLAAIRQAHAHDLQQRREYWSNTLQKMKDSHVRGPLPKIDLKNPPPIPHSVNLGHVLGEAGHIAGTALGLKVFRDVAGNIVHGQDPRLNDQQYQQDYVPAGKMAGAIDKALLPSSFVDIAHGHVPTGAHVGEDALFFLPWSRGLRATGEAIKVASEMERAASAGDRVSEAAKAAAASYRSGKGLLAPVGRGIHLALSPNERALARSEGRKNLIDILKSNPSIKPNEARSIVAQVDAAAAHQARIGNLKDAADLYDQIAFKYHAQPPEDLKGLYQLKPPEAPPPMPDKLSVRGLSPRIYKMIRQGAMYRDWYKRAASELTYVASRLGVEKTQMAAVTAIMSQQANPTFNLRRAVDAIQQFKATGRVDPAVFLSGQAEKAQQILSNPGSFDWAGLKTNHYFGNILQHMDPKAYEKLFPHVPVTVDRHMAEMFLGKQRITDKQYEAVRQIMIRTAHKLGWDPSEVQAAAWVAFKAGKMSSAAEAKALGREMMANGEIPQHLMPVPGEPKKAALARQKERSAFTKVHFDAGRRAVGHEAKPFEHYLPSAGEAYGPGVKKYGPEGEMRFQRVQRENTFSHSVAQIASEAKPDPQAGEEAAFLRAAYDRATPAEQHAYDTLMNKAVDGQFERVVGLEHLGNHEGPGIWRGEANRGIASHVFVGNTPADIRLTQENIDKLEAVATAQAIVKNQHSISWGRPMPEGYGTFKAIHWDPVGQDVAGLSGSMDTVAGEGNVGFIHAPDGGFYVVDFTGQNEGPISRLGGHQTPIGWDGGYVISKADGTGTPFEEALAKLAPDVRQRLEYKINQVRAQTDLLAEHYLHVPVAKLVDLQGAEKLAEGGQHAFHGTNPMTAEQIMQERKLAVGYQSDPAAAWTTTNPGLADFHASGGGENIVAIPRRSIPGHYEGPFGTHGSPTDILFQTPLGHLPTEELHARYDQLNAQYDSVVEKIAKQYRAGDYKRVTAYQNAVSKKLGRKGLKYPTVKEQARAMAEDQIQAAVLKNPESAGAQALNEAVMEMKALRTEIARRNDLAFQRGSGADLASLQKAAGGDIKGAFEQLSPTQAIIHLTNQFDVTTVPHELAHFLESRGLTAEQRDFAQSVYGDLSTTAAREKFALAWESWIRSGSNVPKNLKPEFQTLEHAFRQVYPARGALPVVSQEEAALFRTLVNERDGFPATMYYLLRSAVVSGKLSSARGAARNDIQHEQHLNDVRAYLRSQGYGRPKGESRIPLLGKDEITAETGGVEGQAVRHALQGKVNTEGMGAYEAAGAKLDLGTSAAAARNEREAGYSIERGKRISRARDAASQEGMTGFERYMAHSAELKGQLPQDAWRNMQGDVRDHLDTLLHFVFDHPGTSDWEHQRAADALLRGVERGEAPNRSEEQALRLIFGAEATRSLREAIQKGDIGRLLLELASVPRAIMASFDFGAGLRQGIMFGVARPGLFADVYKNQFRLIKEANFDFLMKAIEESPNAPIYDAMKIQFTTVAHKGELLDLSKREEYFASHIAEMIPGIRASDRLYTGFLNLARKTYADFMIEMGSRVGYDMSDPHVLESVGTYINAATGRGPLYKLQKASAVLNALLFSPRLLMSRIAFLNPFFYMRLHPLARYEALRAARNLTILVGGVGFMAHLAGAKVSLDPTNADFAKIRFGNTRIDPTAGFTQEVRLMAQMIEGHVTSSITGRQEKLTGNAFAPSRFDILLRWFRQKTNPMTGFLWDLSTGHNTVGQPISFTSELQNYFEPLVLQDTLQMYHQHGNIPATAGALAASEAGVGVQTYGTPKKSTKSETSKLISDSQAAGLGAPPQPVLDDVKWENMLNNSVFNGESPFSKAKTAAKLYDERFGTNFSTSFIPQIQTQGEAEQTYLKLRAGLFPNLSKWQSAIAKAQQAQKDQQPVPSSAPAPAQHAAAPAQAPPMQEAAYHIPAKDAGQNRTLAAHGAAPSGASAYIATAAQQRGLDPQAVLAVASMEGLSGGVGDGGTSFGPFQLHEGGALPAEVAAKGAQYAQAWAWSPAGIHYALDRIASVAKGLTGQAAVAAIVHGFERSSNQPAEIAGAMSRYGGVTGGGSVSGGIGGAGGGAQAVSIPGAPAADPLQQSAMEGLQALASGTYNPSVQILHLFRSEASSPLQTSVNGIAFHLGTATTKAARGAISLAQQYLNTPYVYGGESPSGFDCSGLMQYIWARQGISIPRTSQQQFAAGMPVGKNQLRPGDEVFFVGSDGTKSAPGHVGIYIGNGKFIEAPHTGSVVRVSSLRGYPGFVGARRFG